MYCFSLECPRNETKPQWPNYMALPKYWQGHKQPPSPIAALSNFSSDGWHRLLDAAHTIISLSEYMLFLSQFFSGLSQVWWWFLCLSITGKDCLFFPCDIWGKYGYSDYEMKHYWFMANNGCCRFIQLEIDTNCRIIRNNGCLHKPLGHLFRKYIRQIYFSTRKWWENTKMDWIVGTGNWSWVLMQM